MQQHHDSSVSSTIQCKVRNVDKISTNTVNKINKCNLEQTSYASISHFSMIDFDFFFFAGYGQVVLILFFSGSFLSFPS